MRLKGKIALVMATGQGNGASIAESFVDEGAVVCVAGPDPAAAAALTAALRNRGGIATALACAANYDPVGGAVAEAIAIFGRIDILVNSTVAEALPVHCALPALYHD